MMENMILIARNYRDLRLFKLCLTLHPEMSESMVYKALEHAFFKAMEYCESQEDLKVMIPYTFSHTGFTTEKDWLYVIQV